VLVNVVHAEGLDAKLADQPLLGRVDVAEANVDELLGLEAGRHPLVERRDVGPREAEQERDGAAVEAARRRRVGRVDVGVGVDLAKVSGVRLRGTCDNVQKTNCCNSPR
jgi:hypothetical protein